MALLHISVSLEKDGIGRVKVFYTTKDINRKSCYMLTLLFVLFFRLDNYFDLTAGR